MKKTGKTGLNIIFWPVLSGVLLAISAIPSNFYYLNFIAFIPLFFAAEYGLKCKKPFLTFMFQLFLFLVVFYLWVGYWVLQTANLGFLIGLFIVVPFVLLVSPYILFLKRRNKLAPIYFIAAWLTAEWIQLYFELGTPFYNLGNSLAANPKIIQWYEYLGSSGGSLWILVVNFTLYLVVKSKKYRIIWSSVAIAIIIVPLILSTVIFNAYKEKGLDKEVLIIHPSTDNADVKYRVNIYELMDIYLGIMKPQLTANTDYVVLPETAITNAGWISDYNRNLVFNHFFENTVDFPKLKLVTGAITYEAIPDIEKIRGYKKIPGIRYSEKYKTWYYTYNAALLLEKGAPVQIRVKEGLVPYQEYAPYPRLLPRIKPVGIDFQFSLRKNNRNIFVARNQEKVAAFICYELVNGKFFLKKAQKGAEVFFMLLNEGWYHDPKVPRQFLQLSVIRAIENRRSIAQSSNLGISAFINQKGEIVDKTDSKTSGYLYNKIKMNKEKTVYTILGNYLSLTALLVMVILIIREIFFVDNHMSGSVN